MRVKIALHVPLIMMVQNCFFIKRIITTALYIHLTILMVPGHQLKNLISILIQSFMSLMLQSHQMEKNFILPVTGAVDRETSIFTFLKKMVPVTGGLQ